MEVPNTSPVKATSSLPRMSKLPVQRSRPSQLPTPSIAPKSAPQTIQIADVAPTPSKSLPKLQKRTSIAGMSQLKAPSAIGNLATSSNQTTSRQPSVGSRRLAKPSTVGPSTVLRTPSRDLQARAALRPWSHLRDGDEADDTLSELSNNSRPISRQSISEAADEGSTEDLTEIASNSHKRIGPRPSLSDRTIESLQSIPTTPKERKTSKFFSSSVASPSSTASFSMRSVSDTLHSSRPGTSDSTTDRLSVRAVSPAKRLPSPVKSSTRHSLGGFGFSPAPRRTSSFVTSKISVEPSEAAAIASYPVAKKPVTASTSNVRTSATLRGRTSKQQLKVDLPASRSLTKSPFPTSDNERTPRASESAGLPKAEPTAVKSSMALREQIAAAKAAARAAKAAQRADSHQDANSEGAQDGHPMLQPDLSSPQQDEKQILRTKVNKARLDGSLNLSGLELFELPSEVMSMYDPADMEAANITWSEATDLVRLVAADNQFESLDDRAFPDQSTEELSDAGNMRSCQFRGLTYLDLHGNVLNSIPKGFRWLERLTSLDLARNKLENSAAETISEIKSLRHLNLSHNQFAGNLPSSFCQLDKLESFTIQDNRLLGLPETLRGMTNLRILNVAGNQLTALPMAALQQLPLTELNASNNALIASLFPLGSISSHQTMQTLNVANNSLAALAFSELLDLSELRSLDISNNHLTGLPPINSWTEMHTLLASENKFSEFPAGFTLLTKLRTADFTGNDIRLIDPDIGRMDSLEVFNISANPLREKKFLTMSAADIRKDLKLRLEPEEGSVTSRDDDIWADAVEHGSRPSTAVGDPSWIVTASAVLDLKSKNLNSDSNDHLAAFFSTHIVRTAQFQSNLFASIPTCLNMAASLSVLDLSQNPFASSYLTQDLSLPALTQLRLASCRLNDISPLEQYMKAPLLQSLDVTANRLAGELPVLRNCFPSLTALFASDNRFSSLTADSLRGLQVANISSNDLERLPPEIGLLWDEGLRSLEVGSNIFRMPNYQILQKGTEATLRWLRNHLPAAPADS